MKLNLNGKMLLYILGTAMLIYLSTLGYISFDLKKTSTNNALKTIQSRADDNAKEVERILNDFYESIHVSAFSFVAFQDEQVTNADEHAQHMLNKIISSNPDISCTWLTFEPGLTEDSTAKRFAISYKRVNDTIIEDTNYAEAYLTDSYLACKQQMTMYIAEPYIKDGEYFTAIEYPLLHKNSFQGLIGMEFPLQRLQELIVKNTESKHSSFLISQTSHILASNHTKQRGQLFNSAAGEIANKYNKEIQKRQSSKISFIQNNPFNGSSALFSFSPISFDGSNEHWLLILAIPEKEAFSEAYASFGKTVLISAIGLILMAILIFLISKNISNPIIRTTRRLHSIANGELDLSKPRKRLFEDEITDITSSTMQLAGTLSSAADFALNIGKGKLDASYKKLSSEDVLGEALLTMQDSLRDAKEKEDIKKEEDEKRNWVTQGLAKFGEIIRKNNDNMELFCTNVLQELQGHLHTAQAAIYVQDQKNLSEDKSDHYVMMAAWAYGDQVMLHASTEKGIGILGRSIAEKRLIQLNHLPEDYAEISPGMSNMPKPNNLLISPLTINENVFGVLELLTNEPFKDHEVEFIEKLSENIASVISSVNVNINTAKLLQQSQEQADELAQHEEEMRQNLEELQATQEEAQKRESGLLSYLKAVKQNVISVQLNLDRRVIEMSPAMSAKYDINIDSVRGKYYDALIFQDEAVREEFLEFWGQLKQLNTAKRVQKVETRGRTMVFLETYTVLRKDGVAKSILMVAEEKTKERELNEVLKIELDELNGREEK